MLTVELLDRKREEYRGLTEEIGRLENDLGLETEKILKGSRG